MTAIAGHELFHEAVSVLFDISNRRPEAPRNRSTHVVETMSNDSENEDEPDEI